MPKLSRRRWYECLDAPDGHVVGSSADVTVVNDTYCVIQLPYTNFIGRMLYVLCSVSLSLVGV